MVNLHQIQYEVAPYKYLADGEAEVPLDQVPPGDWTLHQGPYVTGADAQQSYNMIMAELEKGARIRNVKVYETDIPEPLLTDVTAAAEAQRPKKP